MKQENLNPEIEEKLLNLQRFQEKQMKVGEPSTSTIATPSSSASYITNVNNITNTVPVKTVSKKRPASRGDDDEEWVMDTPRKRPSRTTEKKPLVTVNTNFTKVPHTSFPQEEKKKEIITTVVPPSVGKKSTPVKKEVDKKKQHHHMQVSF